ncbi:hypothetical protein LJ737_15885 [Hymenobacter sp. 15J16-1T3B]|uniref:hypothetical protein n=1 Tax=Hymenobacter sp. 15J16-1T3B TaxID=2886941 RepID=UPI001D123FFE|nr:hypothetical protein [Hymenobacter sp. 15J16-1T3B]MCC3158725.1 hypothetical protein [Hymenobacter sp. 15J16-1T3B]
MDVALFVFLFLLLASPVLWMVSVVLLLDWRRFWQFFLLNLALLAGYLMLFFGTELLRFGHDEYGLRQAFGALLAVTLHVVLGFGFAVGFRLYQRHAA